MTNDATAQEMRTFLIIPVGVGIVAKEMGVMLRVECRNELLRLSKLEHTLVVFVHIVSMLVEKRAILHVLVVKDGRVNRSSGVGGSCYHRKGDGKFHFY